MRILIVVHGFPPAAIGGTEICAEAQARAFAAAGDDVLVVTRDEDRRRREHDVRIDERGTIRVAFINNTWRGTRSFEESYQNARIGAIAARLIDDFRPDVAHIHHLTGLSTTIVRSLAGRDVPVFMTLHDYWLICHRGQLLDLDGRLCEGPESDGCHRCIGHVGGGPVAGFAAPAFRAVERGLPEPAGRRLRQGAMRLAAVGADDRTSHRQEQLRLEHMKGVCADVTHFIAPSDFVRDRFVGFGIPSDRISVLRNGINTRSTGARLERSRYDGPLRLGFIGSLMFSKAPHVLLEAAADVRRGATALAERTGKASAEPTVTVDLFGAPAAYHGDESYLHQLQPLLEQPHVRSHGAISRDQLPDAFATMDLLVVPSIWPETSSLVIQEAFAAGVPVVASRIGAIPELVEDGRNGLLFEAGRPDDLSRVLERVRANPALVNTLRAGISPVRAVEEQAGALRALYAARVSKPPSLPRRIAAVVLNYRTPDDTLLVLKSLLASSAPLDRIIVVDNDDRPTAREIFSEAGPAVTYLRTGRNLGYSGGMNAGIREALARGADAVLLTNSDVIVPPDCVSRLSRAIDLHPEAGIAGPMVVSRSDPGRVASLGMSYSRATGRMRHAGYGQVIRSLDTDAAETVDGVSGCLMLVRREVFDAIGLLDDDYFFSFEDLAFCLKARTAGFSTLMARSAVVYHEGSRSMGPDTPRRLFFAARNHLLLGHRADSGAGPVGALRRNASIVMLNVAHAVRSNGGSLPTRLSAVARGVRDYARGRFGVDV